MIAVLTCPRKIDYLPFTLHQIDQSATSRNKIIFNDGREKTPIPVGWHCERVSKPESEEPRANRYPFWSCLANAVDLKEDLIFFEDDLCMTKNAAIFSELVSVPPEASLLSLYAPFGSHETAKGIEVKSAKSFAFCQAMKIPLHTCKFLCSMIDVLKLTKEGGSDACINRILSSMHMNFGTLYPGIVQHIGDESAVMGTHFGKFKSSAFAGMEFDAMSLSPIQETRVM